jgi:hypothetical protein
VKGEWLGENTMMMDVLTTQPPTQGDAQRSLIGVLTRILLFFVDT